VTDTPLPKGLPRRRARHLQDAVAIAFRALDQLGELTDDELPVRLRELAPALTDPEQASKDALGAAAALVIEAHRRSSGLTLFPVQVLGGLAVLTGSVAEMQTGEGKTFTVLLPACVHALAGNGVHVATANDYLAARDAAQLTPTYALLGFSVAVANHGDAPAARRAAYAADVTYGTASTFGFDYLDDNLVTDPAARVQRGFHACIVDEADSLLVDEASTPLVLSEPARPSEDWAQMAAAVHALDETDVLFDRAERWAALTHEGAARCAELLGVESIYTQGDRLARLLACVRGRFLFEAGNQYVVTGEPAAVVLVDEHTGRLLPGQRLRDGLHEAIEALNGVPVHSAQVVSGQTTLQSFFGMYRFLGGLTGTASQLADEFWETYGLSVAVIPTNRPSRRTDHPDRFYATASDRLDALVAEVSVRHARNQPVLIGTASVTESAEIADALRAAGVDNQVLNARDHADEARIIADAGRPGAVTVSTNMAGRGVDILLGGDPSHHDEGACSAGREVVVSAGGLCVISACRYPSARVDRQLRGRAGRQGDPGETMFLLCGEDDLVRVFAPTALSQVLASRSNDASEVPGIGPLVERAQRRVEQMQRASREHMLEFDGVDTAQRLTFYAMRRRLLDMDFDELCRYLVNAYPYVLSSAYDDDLPLEVVLPAGAGRAVSPQQAAQLWVDSIEARLAPIADHLSGRTLERARLDLVRKSVLGEIDRRWRAHLSRCSSLRARSQLAVYAQLNPVADYADRTLDEFDRLMRNLPVVGLEGVNALVVTVNAKPAPAA